MAALTVSPLAALGANIEEAVEKAAGAWQLEMTTPDGVSRQPIVIVGRQHQELVAWYVENEKPIAVDAVRLEDETLVLSARRQEADGAVEVTLRAKLSADDGECSGEGQYRSLGDGDTGRWSFTGRRIDTSQFDEVTKWNVSFTTPDGQSHNATVTVLEKNGRFYGWYSSPDRELPATRVSVDGEQVAFSLTTKTDAGDKVDVTFRGTMAGERISGSAEYDLSGDTGTFSFQAVRQAGA